MAIYQTLEFYIAGGSQDPVWSFHIPPEAVMTFNAREAVRFPKSVEEKNSLTPNGIYQIAEVVHKFSDLSTDELNYQHYICVVCAEIVDMQDLIQI